MSIAEWASCGETADGRAGRIENVAIGLLHGNGQLGFDFPPAQHFRPLVLGKFR